MPFLILNVVDAEFVNFLGRRFTFDALFLAREVPGKTWSLVSYYWPLTCIGLFILCLFSFLIFRFVPYWSERVSSRLSRGQTALASLLFFIFLFVSARGGLQNKPIGFAHSQIFLNPTMNNLVLNSSFTFLQTVRRKSLPRDQFFQNKEEMLHWLNPSGDPISSLQGFHPAKKPNVVLIIVESFALEYMGKPHRGLKDSRGYTPFLDELADKSLFFPNTFANARRSIEGIGAIVGGIPALMNEPFISSQYLTNYFLGLGTLLTQEGYHTSFFHGAHNGSMYFDQFMKSAGVQHYFGQNEYPRPEETDGTWGIWDEPFLQWMSGQLNDFPQPFFSAVFTLTSHHPFKIPDQYAGKFPKGTIDIHESVGYTDYALRKFFETAAKAPWYDNTIFVLTADHTYKNARPEYDNELGHYRVPLIIFSPKIQLPRVDTKEIVQHIDILPTILDLVGAHEKEKNYLGRSVFVPTDRFAVSFLEASISLSRKIIFCAIKRARTCRCSR